MPPDATPPPTGRLHVALTALLVLLFVVASAGLWLRAGFSGWLDAALLVVATAQAISALSRQLPSQNVFWVILIIAAVAWGTDYLNLQTGIPFGPVVFGAIGPALLNVPWARPLVWIVILLNSRGLARLILRPWRKTKTYGFRLIGLTTALVAIFEFAFEPFAWHVKQYWFWQQTKLPMAWQGAPVSVFLSTAVVTLLILAFTTPLLINKQLSKKRGPDFPPLAVWLGAVLLFAIGLGAHNLWLAATVDILIAIVVAIFAIRGARW